MRSSMLKPFLSYAKRRTNPGFHEEFTGRRSQHYFRPLVELGFGMLRPEVGKPVLEFSVAATDVIRPFKSAKKKCA